MSELGVALAGKRYMEIGTGWYPTLPVCFQLAGAAAVTTYDLQRHMNARLTDWMFQALGNKTPADFARTRAVKVIP